MAFCSIFSYTTGIGRLILNHVTGVFYLLTVLHRLQIFSPLLKLPKCLLPILKCASIALGICGWLGSCIPPFTRGKPETIAAYTIGTVFWLLFIIADIAISIIMLRAYFRAQTIDQPSHFRNVSLRDMNRPGSSSGSSSSTSGRGPVRYSKGEETYAGQDLGRWEEELRGGRASPDIGNSDKRRILTFLVGLLIFTDAAVIVGMFVALKEMPSTLVSHLYSCYQTTQSVD